MPKTNRIGDAVHIEDAIAMAGYGRFHLFVLLATGGCLMCVIIETMEMMFIIPAAQCDLQLTLPQKGLLSSISFLGVFTSCHLWGFIADTRGRRKVLLISLCMSFLISIASSLVPESWMFILLRYLNGIFIAGSSAVIYAFAGEFHDNVFRPKVVTWMATFVALGNIYLPALAWLILEYQWSYPIPLLNVLFRPWRLLVIIYSLPCLVFAILLSFLPESPKYLLSQGRSTEALVIVKKMYEVNKPGKEFLVKELFWDDLNVVVKNEKNNLFKSMWKQTIPLFHKPFLWKTCMLCFLQYGLFTSTTGIVMWYPEILNALAKYMESNPEKEVALCSALKNDIESKNFSQTLNEGFSCADSVDTNVFYISIIIGSFYALCYILIGTIINIVGKKQIMYTFLITGALSGITAQHVSGYTSIQVLIGIFLMGGAAIGVVNAIVVDLFPTEIRAMALSLSLMCGRLGAVTGSNVIGPIIYKACNLTFFATALDHLVLIVIVFLLPSSPQEKKMIEPI